MKTWLRWILTSSFWLLLMIAPLVVAAMQQKSLEQRWLLSTDGQISVRYPADWIATSDPAAVNRIWLASSPAAAAAPSGAGLPALPDNISMQIVSIPASAWGLDAEDSLDMPLMQRAARNLFPDATLDLNDALFQRRLGAAQDMTLVDFSLPTQQVEGVVFAFQQGGILTYGSIITAAGQYMPATEQQGLSILASYQVKVSADTLAALLPPSPEVTG